MPGRQVPVVAALVTYLSVCAVVSATELVDGNADPIWQLSLGQMFRANVTTDYQTVIDIADSSAEVSGSDRMTLQYEIVRQSSGGHLLVEVRILSLERTQMIDGADQETESLLPEDALNSAVLVLDVGPTGEVTPIGHENTIKTDSPETQRTLNRYLGSDVFRSWLDLPFWVPVGAHVAGTQGVQSLPESEATADTGSANQEVDEPAASPADDSSAEDEDNVQAVPAGAVHWNRSLKISLGLLGAVTVDARCETTEQQDSELRFSISGRPEHVPPDAALDSPTVFDRIRVETTKMEGYGRMRTNPLTGLPADIDIQQQLGIEGNAVVQSAGRSADVRFKRTMTRSCQISEIRSRKSRPGLSIEILPKIPPK